MRKHLKLQQELFLAFTIDRLALPGSNQINRAPSTIGSSLMKRSPSLRPRTPTVSTPLQGSADVSSAEENLSASSTRAVVPPARGETRDLILETLSDISGHPSFMVDLYANYDCDVNCENLFERLVDFLTKVRIIAISKKTSVNLTIFKGVYPAQNIGSVEVQRNSQYLCLEFLLTFVNDMAMRADGVGIVLRISSHHVLTSPLGCRTMAAGRFRFPKLYAKINTLLGVPVTRIPAASKVSKAVDPDGSRSFQCQTKIGRDFP